MAVQRKRIVALGGAGMDIEAVDAASELLLSAGFPVEILTPPHAEAAVKTHGVPLPDETKRLCREADGVLFGAAGGPASSAVVGWLRWEQGAYAGVRPIKYYIANPTATLLSASMMLDHMGLAAEAARLEAGVARVYRDGKALTADQGGTATTRDFCQAVLAAIRNG